MFPEGTAPERHWQRLSMDQAVARRIARLGPADRSAVEISGSAHRDRGWARYESLSYPAFDLCAPPDDPGRWDVVICEQVLEHVIDPRAAAATLRLLCQPGGHLIVTSPFLVKQHELAMFGMKDYWRFTTRGLQVLLEEAGFVVDVVDSWGNKAAVLGNLGQWAEHRRWLPMRNDPEVAVQIWVFAHNPD